MLEEVEALSPGERTGRLPQLDDCLAMQHFCMQPPTKPVPGTITWDVKRKLAVSLAGLTMENCFGMIEVLQSCGEGPEGGEGEVEVNLDTLPLSVIQKLQV